MVAAFENYTSSLVDTIFPEKNVTISNLDQPFITEELNMLRRHRIRIYNKQGRSQKYLEVRNHFETKLKLAAKKYWLRVLQEAASGKSTNSYAALKKLELGSVENKVNFTLPSHAEEGLSPEQSAERLAVYFSKISQEFEPINPDKFPPYIKKRLQEGKTDPSKPVLLDWQVYKKLMSSKKPNSLVPGDLPVKLVKEFTPELAKPVATIYNRITQTAEYPRQWVVEYQLCIPKVQPPLSEDNLRNLASTAYLSKQYESFIGDWILPYLEPFIDPGQCGGLKGSSITHYLVRLLNFVHLNLDKNQPHAVLLALVDLEKAFNRVSHQLVIQDLADMKVPGWLLLILISYLTERSMFMRYNGSTSSMKLLPGSSPQGAFLGILLFIIIFNGALLRPRIPRPDALCIKYIDDLSSLTSINLKSALLPDPVTRPEPLNYNERTKQILPLYNNKLQGMLDELKQFATKNFFE